MLRGRSHRGRTQAGIAAPFAPVHDGQADGPALGRPDAATRSDCLRPLVGRVGSRPLGFAIAGASLLPRRRAGAILLPAPPATFFGSQPGSSPCRVGNPFCRYGGRNRPAPNSCGALIGRRSHVVGEASQRICQDRPEKPHRLSFRRPSSVTGNHDGKEQGSVLNRRGEVLNQQGVRPHVR